ncbi:MAG: hypothetical protein J5496_07540 [Lachnospiraceae bacterium]|nr:hypothetical protein [Lachnospiraceae bacterium]
MYSEQELRHAAEFRDEIHREALMRVRAVCPDAGSVIDRHPVEEYFQEVWDYPGKWYTTVAIPTGYGSRRALVEALVRDTLVHCRAAGLSFENDAFYRLIAAYPDLVCEYCIVTADDRSAEEEAVFPYRGAESHRRALHCACRRLFEEEGTWSYDISRARGKKQSSKALFAPAASEEGLNYRKAFLFPPHENAYTDRDFDRVGAVLFPGGAEGLELYRWTTDWSEYFNEGREWWGTLCLSVYDKSLDRFVVIMASATD